MKRIKLIFGLMLSLLLGACSTTVEQAPSSKPAVVTTEATRMQVAGEKDWRPASHVVLRGDTLYSIAFYYGLDYHDLEELNGIKNPRLIQVGQVLRLFSAESGSAEAATAGTSAAPVIKDQPRVVKYVYNAAALAQIDDVQNSNAKSYKVPGATVEVLPLDYKSGTTNSKVVAKSVRAEPRSDTAIINTEEDGLQWAMPASGKIVANFSEVDNRKGIDIAGKLGQDVLASAPGKVVYSGSGLRGYGKLIIIKHNKTFLSAYAHNDKILVKEGQTVSRGEKIASMGKTDSSSVKLHFEVRRLGKPVDPAKYLPKS